MSFAFGDGEAIAFSFPLHERFKDELFHQCSLTFLSNPHLLLYKMKL